jgi:cytochrome b
MPDPADLSSSPAPAAAPSPPAPETVVPTRVWDLPTRAFHIALLLCVAGLLITGHIGGSAMIWHFRLGYTVLALVVFRVLWGFVGGRWSRFAHFVRGPGTVLRYLQGRTDPQEHHEVGHNPLGALSVLGLLGLLALQVACGLISDDEIANIGPLNRFVPTEWGLTATAWHKDWGQWLLIAAIVLHIGAIVFYRVRHRKDLVSPMLHGDKLLEPGTPASRDDGRSRGLALVLLLACAGLAVAVARLAP